MTARTMFPTLADLPREQWPDDLRVHPAPPEIGGSEDAIECRCQRAVPSRDMVDLREIPAGRLASLGVPDPVCCQGCFHLHEWHGRVLHHEIASALGMAAPVVASLESGAKEAARRGWHVKTARNARHFPTTP